MITVVPAPGREVRDPVNYTLVPAEGREIDETNIYWARRLRDGDVLPVDPPPADPPDDPAATVGGA